MQETSGGERLRPWERWFLAGLLAVTVGFGAVVELRSAFLSRRMGDLGVFLRAGWAVRTGADLYEVTCDNGWHYNYPPLFAILMAPFADPPAGAAPVAAVPYAASVAMFYLLNIFSLALAVHLLAGALEAAVLGPPPLGSRRWWYLRVAPALACLAPIGHTFARGQVNVLLLLLVCGAVAGLLRGRRLTAGFYLAGAVCLKIIPVYLLVWPLWRRDGRCLAGCALGLLAGLLVIPGAVIGPRRTADSFRDLYRVLLAPSLGLGSDRSRADELVAVTATNNQAFRAMIHYALHRDPHTRPRDAAPAVRRAHWLIGAALTLATLLAVRRRAASSAALGLGALAVVMLLVSPVCHTHYFALNVPLVMALMAAGWEREAAGGPAARFLTLPVSPWLFAVTALHALGNALPLPGELCWRLREFGVAGYATLLLWLAGFVTLCRRPAPPSSAAGRARAAA